MAKKVEKGKKKLEQKKKSLPMQKVNERIRRKLMEKQKLAIGSTWWSLHWWQLWCYVI